MQDNLETQSPEETEPQALEDLIEIVPPNYTVGELYIKGRTQFPNNVKTAFFTNSGNFLECYVWMPPKKYVKSFAEGDLQYGVYEKDGILLFIYKHAGGDWSVAPFNINLVPEAYRVAIDTDSEGRISMKGVLVDGRTGKVRAVRELLLNKSVSEVIVNAAKKQLEASREEAFDTQENDRRVKMLMVKGPEMVARNMTATGISKIKKPNKQAK